MATDDSRAGPPRPSWLGEPCPSWCTRDHAEDDHVEDRVHLDEATLLEAVVADVDPASLLVQPRSTELVVQRRLPADAPGSRSWVRLSEAEGSLDLTLSPETAALLGRALPRHAGPGEEPDLPGSTG